MMTTYDPLTPQQIALLAEVAADPIVISVQAQANSPRGRDITFLSSAGFSNIEAVHIAQNMTDNTFRFSRSNKPYS